MTTAATGDAGGCIFCAALSNNSELILYRGKHVFIILNKFPYNNGHLMLVPNRHISTLSQLSDEELDELGSFIRTTEIAINEAYKPNGINVGINVDVLPEQVCLIIFMFMLYLAGTGIQIL